MSKNSSFSSSFVSCPNRFFSSRLLINLGLVGHLKVSLVDNITTEEVVHLLVAIDFSRGLCLGCLRANQHLVRNTVEQFR